jgi:hypothetical protein
MENRVCIVDEACLQRRYLAMDSLLLRAKAGRMFTGPLPSDALISSVRIL